MSNILNVDYTFSMFPLVSLYVHVTLISFQIKLFTVQAIYSYNRRNNQTFNRGIIWSKVNEIAKKNLILKKKKVENYTS